MNDFLGQELRVDDYCTYPGAGNRKAEYGLVLHRITEVGDSYVKTQRLKVRYHNQRTAVASHSTTTIKKTNKLTKIIPPPLMIMVFESPDEHGELIGKWLHGQTDIDWSTLACGTS